MDRHRVLRGSNPIVHIRATSHIALAPCSFPHKRAYIYSTGMHETGVFGLGAGACMHAEPAGPNLHDPSRVVRPEEHAVTTYTVQSSMRNHRLASSE